MRPKDENLTARFLEEDPEAVKIIQQWIDSAASPFRRHLAEDWRDAKQEAFLKVFQSLQQGAFRGDSSLKTYVGRVTFCCCIDLMRARSKPLTVDLDGVAGELPSPGKSPEDAVGWREMLDLLDRILRELTSDCYALLIMTFTEGRSYQEISQQQGVSQAALRQRVHRCLTKARAILARL